jgi:hypothetical protein
VLADELAKAGAAGDTELLAAAKSLAELINSTAKPATPKYDVTIRNSQGILVGDGNVQVNRFGAADDRTLPE